MVQEEFEQFYQTLRLPRGADAARLRSAYKELAQKWHPDRQNNPLVPREASEAIFKEITRAYAVLNRYQRTHRALPFEYDLEPTPPSFVELQAASARPAGIRRKVLLAGFAATLVTAVILSLALQQPTGDANHLQSAPQPNIQLGDSQERVLEVLGRPTYLSRSRWQYGMSEVYFENGQVSGWHDAKQTPLADAVREPAG